MWAGHGGWGAWPIQQSAFANIPSEEVDWASLAKQWIAQREVMGMTSAASNADTQYASQPLQHVPAAPPPPPPPPQSTDDVAPGDLPAGGREMEGADSSTEPAHGVNYEGEHEQSGWDGWQNAGWGMSNWTVPPPPPPSDSHEGNIAENRFQSAESYPYGFGHGMNEYYQPAPFEFGNGGGGSADSGYSYWPDQRHQQMPGPPPHQQISGPSTLEYRPPPRRAYHPAPVHAAVIPGMIDESGLDAAKRRQLPAWIREGLEKMEREKQRQLEKEKQIHDAANAKKLQEDVNREAVSEENAASEGGLMAAVKSRFDSDDDDDNDADHTNDGETLTRHDRNDNVDNSKIKPSSSPVDVFVSEEERQAQIMMRVRQLLTEVLLDVTNREIADVVHAVFVSAKAKQARAPAKQLAKSSALASITSLGLGYGSGSESDDEADDTSATGRESPAAESSDDEELQDRIQRKKTEFERKMRELEESENDADETKQQQSVTVPLVSRLQQKTNISEKQAKPETTRSDMLSSEQHDADKRLAGDIRERRHETKQETDDNEELADRTVRKDNRSKTEHVKSSADKQQKWNSKDESSQSDSDSDSSSSSESLSEPQSSDEASKRHAAKRSRTSVKERPNRRHKTRPNSSKHDSSRETSGTGRDDDDSDVYHHSRKEMRHRAEESDVQDSDRTRDESHTHDRHATDDRQRSRRSDTDRHNRHKRTSDADDRKHSRTKKRQRSSRSRSRSSERRERHKSRHEKSSPAERSQHYSSKRRRQHSSHEHSHRSSKEHTDRSGRERSGKKSHAKHRSRSSSRSSYYED